MAQTYIDIYIDYFSLEKFEIKSIFCQLCGKIHLRKQNPIGDLKIGGQKWNILRIKYMEIGLLALWSGFNLLGTGMGMEGTGLSLGLQCRWDSLQQNKINRSAFWTRVGGQHLSFWPHSFFLCCMDKYKLQTMSVPGGAAWRGVSGNRAARRIRAIPHNLKRFPGSEGIPVLAWRIQMLEQHVPCNLVIALWAVTEIRASVGSEEPRWLCLPCLAFSESLFIYLFHCVLGRKANLICCIVANSACVGGALNILISWVPVGKWDIACQGMRGEGEQGEQSYLKVLDFLNTVWCCPQQATQTQNLARGDFRVWTHLGCLGGRPFVGCYLLPSFIGKG